MANRIPAGMADLAQVLTGSADPTDLAVTGERILVGRTPLHTLSEHVQRYLFAAPHTRDCATLDVACGTGYGSAILASAGAKSVLGVDRDAESVAYARRNYAGRRGLSFAEGDALALDLPDGSLDVVVSFETLEHLPDPGRFLDEIARVLVPGGLAIVSTPNRSVYSAGLHRSLNLHHVVEYNRVEFAHELGKRFASVQLFGQANLTKRQVVQWWIQARVWATLPRGRQLKEALYRRLAPSGAGAVDLSELEAYADEHAVRPLGRREAPQYLVALARKAKS